MGKDNRSTSPKGSSRFIGTSHAMSAIYEKIKRIAPSDIPVFISGETGTGKEICAESIHSFSKRHEKPFVVLNCAALAPALIDSALFGHVRGAYTNADFARDGAIAKAQGGTLFLDEIGDMPLESQVKLLRFTQKLNYQKLGCDKILKADVRLICATNIDLTEKVRKKLFREDLYYRLHVAPIIMPPLRDRGEDWLDLAHYFLEIFCQKYSKSFIDFSDAAIMLLRTYPWSGNVRELENMIHEIVSGFDGTQIELSMIPDRIKLSYRKNIPQQGDSHEIPPPSLPLWKVEKRAIENALHQVSGNVQQAAAILGVAPSTIYRKIQSWKE